MNAVAKYITIAAALGATSGAGFLAWRARTDLVTLHVRNAPLSEVVAKMRWQTWETFVVNPNVKGTVTLDVDKMPLNGVLAILGEQLNARWSTLYPIYQKKTSLISLERALRGETKMEDTLFTNNRGGAMGFRGEPSARPSELVTLHLTNTDLAISAQALERFGGGQVLIEKGASPKVSLELNNIRFEKAVKEVAHTVGRSSTRLYALQAMRGPGNGEVARGEGRTRPDQPREVNPEVETQRLEKMQQVLQTLPEEERKRAEERQLERMAMQSLTPEQRQQAMAERMNSPEMQQRSEQRTVSGIKNTTPEQRHERYERMYNMRKARAAGTAARNG